ncbi:tripartite tricarboxylate transporter substrate binding protein [Ramlibacter sp. AN1015]|uniref:Bug family tripartite tricarboxylate transporter substrate binding protein n=1 Tax=Ramlibacter sp. AN1015 TaxID=3133428 RepID=UPI0030C534DE
MKINLRRRDLLALTAASCLPAANAFAQGATYPNKAIRLIVPYPAGGSTDIPARIIMERVSQILGQPVVVDNRAGAGGRIGAELVARAAPDGYTLAIANSSTHVLPAALHKTPPPYDSQRDFTPIGRTLIASVMVMVNPQLPVKNIPEFLAYIKANPGKVTIASPGLGTLTHLSGEMLKLRTGIDVPFVHYKGDVAAMTDTIAGHVMAIVTPAGEQQHKAGKLRAIGVTGSSRMPGMPDVPTIAEQGVEGFNVVGWNGVVGPANLPKPITDKLNKALVQALQAPDVLSQLREKGFVVSTSTPDELERQIRDEVALWRDVGKKANIVLE